MPCCDVINRGAALYGDLVIFGTLDAQLVALNKDTGKVVWREKVDDYKAGYSMTAAPQIVKGMIITGVSGGEFGVIGRVEARDAKTGKMVWTRPMVEGHMGYNYDKDGKKVENGISGTTNATWPGDLWKTGGAATWQAAYYDPDVNLIFMGTGNPAPWNSLLRPGDNLYSSSAWRSNPDTGKIVWHYQTTPHDGWDFDGVNEFVSFKYKDPDGKLVKAGAKADRNGFFFVNDRTNGKLLSAFPFVTRIDWAKGYRPEDRAADLRRRQASGQSLRRRRGRRGRQGQGGATRPSFLGGKNQMPMAYSPDTGLFYVPANEWGMDIWNEPVSYKRGAAYLGAGFTIKPLYEDYIGAHACDRPGERQDRVGGQEQRAAVGRRADHRRQPGVLWHARGLPEGGRTPRPARNSWQFQTGSGVIAPPVTWEMDGEQYVAVVSGWGGAVPLWGGDVAKRVNYPRAGRHRLGVQAAQALIGPHGSKDGCEARRVAPPGFFLARGRRKGTGGRRGARGAAHLRRKLHVGLDRPDLVDR